MSDQENDKKALDVESIIDIIEDWMWIRSKRYEHGPTIADVGHSALLRWLLSGKEPFDEPPPRMMSYPAYHLAAGEKVRPFEVFFVDEDDPIAPGSVVISQSIWNILEEHEDGSYTVQWCENERAKYLLAPLPESEKDRWHEWSLQRIDIDIDNEE